MALSSVLQGESADFSFSNDRAFSFGCGFGQTDLGFGAAPGDRLNFAIKASLGPDDKDGPERKIEFLHGTTTLAFKVN